MKCVVGLSLTWCHVQLIFCLRRTHFCQKHQDSDRCLENGEITYSSAKWIICLLGWTWLKWGSSCVRQWWPIHHTQSHTVWLSNTSNFAFMAVFQSVFQGCQHHVNAGRAAVTPQESHTQHLEGPKKHLSAQEWWESRQNQESNDVISYQACRRSEPPRDL